MKKLVAVLPILALAYSVNANAGFLDGISKVLTTTSGVLGKVTGTPQSPSIPQSTSPDAFGDAQTAIPTVKKYTLPNKETSEYKIEDLTLEIKQTYNKMPPVFISGKFYNKTNQLLNVRVTFPVYDKEGFAQSNITTLLQAQPHEKIKIKSLETLTSLDGNIAIDKVKYQNCNLTNKFGVC